MRYDEDPEVLLRELGLEYRSKGNELQVKCPFCGDGKFDHFSMRRDNGLWNCVKCGEKGNPRTLRAKLGVEQIRTAADTVSEPEEKPEPITDERITAGKKRLEEDREAWEYLTKERGFDPKIIKGMSLILESAYGARWIGFPWKHRKQWRGIKFRILKQDQKFRDVDGKKKEALPRFRREKGWKSILYNRDVLDVKNEKNERKFNRVLVASGETDLLSLYSMGYRAVVATTTGETAMPEDQVKELQSLDRVWILYDNDEVGRKSAIALSRRIGLDKTYVVTLPEGIKDANDFMRAHGEKAKPEMDRLIRESRRLNVPTIHQVTELVDGLREQFKPERSELDTLTPWLGLNRVLPGLTGLIVLSAPQGTGKTTFGLNIAAFWAKARRSPSLFYCMEMTANELVLKTIMSEYHVPITQFKDGNPAGQEILREFSIVWGDTPFYVGYSGVAKQPRDVIALLEEAIVRYELQIVFFDNVHVFRGDDRVQKVGEFSIALKELAMKYEIPVVAIAQPKKMDLGRIMNPWDLAYSSDLYSDADQMIFLHRQMLAATKDSEVFRDKPPETNFSPFTVVRLYKSRFGGPRDVLVYLEGAEHRFRDVRQDEAIEYKGARGGSRQTLVRELWSDDDAQEKIRTPGDDDELPF